jgi:hypothetical protein
MRLSQFLRERAAVHAAKYQLRDWVDAEGRELAHKVLRGEVRRADVEQCARETGDAEPQVALYYLDRWADKPYG